MHTLGRFLIVFLVIGLAAAASGQGFLSAEAVASAVSQEGGMLVEDGESVALADIHAAVQLMAQCTDTFSQVVRVNNIDYLYVHGFAIVSKNAWETRGALALEPAITASTVRAFGNAAAWFNRVRTAYAAGLAKVDNESDDWTELDEALSNAWSSSSQTSVAEAGAIAVSADLAGAQRLGHEVYSLGDQGFCVFARWSFPADQDAFERSLDGSEAPVDVPLGAGGSTAGNADGPQTNPTLPPGYVGGGFRDPSAP